MSVMKITNDNFEAEVMKSEKKVLLDFYADWCGPCKMVAPIVDRLAQEHPEYKVGKINVDDSPELAIRFRVDRIPTLVVIENGQIVNQTLGAKTLEQLLELLA